jgi:site-specific DNA recombinase
LRLRLPLSKKEAQKYIDTEISAQKGAFFTETKRAACYIRVSTDEQIEYSPDSQLREMREYARRAGITILPEHIYVDEGISGRKAETRPAFLKMIANAKKKPKQFDMVLLYKFSRFARSREDSVFYKSLLRKKCGIAVISIKEPLDADNKMSIIMEAFIEAMDEYYSINLSEDVRRTMTEKAMRGEYQTVPPFGYRMRDKSLVPVEKEAALIKYIFDRFNNGESFLELAQSLNAMGIRTHRGNPFENRTIAYILKNPIYVGKVRWRSRVPKKSEPIVAQSQYEPLISQSDWEKAQRRLRQIGANHNFAYKNENRRTDWLSGLVICPSCGRAAVKCGNYWRCGGYAHGVCKKSQYIRDAVLKEAILKKLHDDLAPGLFENDISFAPSDEKRPQACLSVLYTKLGRLREAYLNGTDSLEEYTSEKNALLQEIDLVKRQINLQKSGSNLSEMIKHAAGILYDKNAAPEQKRAAARSIFGKIIYDKDKNLLTIEYHISFCS